MAISTRLRLAALAIVLAFSLTGCGGGGGGDDPPPPAQSDLRITQFSAPSAGTAGASISVSDTVSNNGNGAASAFSVGIYLSTNNVISTADTRVGFRAIPSLAAGASSTASGTVTIPSNLAAGTYFLGAIADDQSAVTESNENNNVSTAAQIAVGVAASGPDLSATAFSAPSTGTAGATISVDSTVSNIGTAAAGAFEVGIYLSNDNVISTTDTLVGTRSVSSLAVGATSAGATTITLPSNLAADTYFLGAIADHANVVSESNEGNNISSQATIVVGAPASTVDLTVSAFTAPSDGTRGGTVSVDTTVSNSGNAAAGAFTVGLYLSIDNVVSTGDTLLETRAVSSLAAGATSAGATTVTLPSTLAAGNYFLGAIADHANAVSESNEGNNVSSQAIAVTAGQPGSFTISGTVTASSVTAVDSDTNDPLQQGRTGNNTPATAQRVGNPAHVIGYANRPLTGPQGPNRIGGDIFDGYQVTLAAGQVVELNFGDPTAADIDLYIYNSTGTILLAGSISEFNRSECVRITAAGEYQVVVHAFRGASNYELAWGPVSLGTTCPIATTSTPDKPSFVTGQFFVKARPSTAGETRLARTASVARSANLTVASVTTDESPVLLEIPSGANARAASMSALGTTSKGVQTSYGSSAQAALALDTAAAIKQLRASGQFEYVEFNGVVEAQQVGYGTWPPNDTLLSRMPHLDLIKLPDTFNALFSRSPRPTHRPIVAVLDTGIVAEHADLTRMLVPGFDFVSSASNAGDGNSIDSNPDDSKPPSSGATFHGTHVAGTIAAETFNGTGIAGVAPMARIMPVRVLGLNGGTTSEVIQGMLFAAGLMNNSGTVPTSKADVINMSLGGPGSCSSSMQTAVNQVRAEGVIVVAAAGNDSGQPVGSPANCQGVIAVSAISYSGAIARYSNVGPQVMVTAPGGDNSRQSPAGTDLIMSTHAAFATDSTTRTPNYASMQGTSMATPHVAGVMALMRAVNPTITPAQIDALFSDNSLTDDVGTPGRDNQFGFGLINALKAINAAAPNAPPPPSGLPTLALDTTRLDFGTVQTQLQITLTRINGSTDSFASAIDSATNANAVTVVPVAGNPAAGPYVLNVSIERSLLNTGEDQIQVEITSAQGRKLRFDVTVAPRSTTPVGLVGVGPVYVLALHPDTWTTLAQDEVTNNQTTYVYTLTNLTTPVIIVAGTDTDNDGFICGASEPCGAFPVLGPTITTISASRNGVSFDLTTGGSAASLSASPAQTQLPAPRGFGRVR